MGNRLFTRVVVATLLVILQGLQSAAAAVGATAGTPSIDAAGAARHVIPIWTPPGIAGIEPALALVYDHRAGNGTLGIGWSLSGLSQIARCPRTIVQDGAAGPVELSLNDRYCLDGVRLRLVSGTYGMAGSVYRTEIDTAARITAVGATGSGPAWFRVEQPDGRVLEYGSGGGGQALATGQTTPYAWGLSRVADRAGNALSVEYQVDARNGATRPARILWTSSPVAGTAHYAVAFRYDAVARPDPISEYVAGGGADGLVLESLRLSALDVQHDGSQVRRYEFGYGRTPGGLSRLERVRECAASSADCLPETTITWLSAGVGLAAPQVTGPALAEPTFAMEVNGDGLEDLVYPAGGTWRYLLGQASGSYSSPHDSGIVATNSWQARPFEWDGDGRDDLLVPWTDGRFRVLRANGSGFDAPALTAPAPGTPSADPYQTYWTADVDGDGRDDLLRADTLGIARVLVRLRSGSGFGAEQLAFYSDFLRFYERPFGDAFSLRQSHVRRADFDGDGREDLLALACDWDPEEQVCQTWQWVAFYGQGGQLRFGNTLDNSYGMAFRPQLGDFNADGKTDVVYPGGGQWLVGEGRGWFVTPVAGPSAAAYVPYGTMVLDWDGDGYSDLLALEASTYSWHLLRSNGQRLESPVPVSLPGAGTGLWAVTDVDGDRQPDVALTTSGTGSLALARHEGGGSGAAPIDAVRDVIDGSGGRATFFYRATTDPAVHAAAPFSGYPDRPLVRPVYVARDLEIAAGGTPPYRLSAAYGGARYQHGGRGPTGFSTRAVTDSRNGLTTTETYRQDHPFTGRVASVTIRQASGQPVHESQLTWAAHVLDSSLAQGRQLPYVANAAQRSYEAGGTRNGALLTETTVAVQADLNGNITSQNVSVRDADPASPYFGQRYATQVSSSWRNDTYAWCLAVPTQQTVVRTMPDGTSTTRTVQSSVDSGYCRVVQEVVQPGQPDVLLTTDYGFDGCGNLGTVASYGSGGEAEARTSSISWGTRCQFPESVTNALGQTSRRSWRYDLGLPSAQADVDGLATRYEYDSFGRLTRELRPDGTAVRHALSSCGSGCPTSAAVYRVDSTERTTADQPVRADRMYLDGVGRLRRQESQSLSGAFAVTTADYDSFGRLSAKSKPFWPGSSTYYTTYAYDTLGRIARIAEPVSSANPSQRSVTLAYEGRLQRITDPRGNTETRTYDALGRLRAVTAPSPGGASQYDYTPFGELASIIDPAGSATRWSRNSRGFVVATSDPDAGNWTYARNAFGQVTSYVDAKGQSTTLTYDRLGRLVRRTEAEGTSTWTWDAAGAGVGRIASIAGPGYAEAFGYDSAGRLANRSITSDAEYRIDYGYEAASGRLVSLTYPVSTAGYRLRLAYDYQNGMLARVRDANAGTVYWQLNTTDAAGSALDARLGAISSLRGYDPANGWLQYSQAGVGYGSALMNVEVKWDVNGNFRERRDLNQSGLTESFYYDSLDRLDYVTRNGTTSLDLTLDAAGNVLWKSDVGNYAYHPVRRRAVTQAGSVAYTYDANGNMTGRGGVPVSWTSYNLPRAVGQPGASAQFWYAPDRGRFRQVSESPTGVATTEYIGGLVEKVTSGGRTAFRHYIAGGEGPVAVYTRRSDGTSELGYLLLDHLGSVSVIADAAGNPLVRPSFDAFGRRRGSDWQGAPSATDLSRLANITRRGFTGHEHLDGVGLVHMNGRVYDPAIGRFLSPDPLIGNPGNGQAANPYAYVLNNPLTLTDPTGFDAVDTWPVARNGNRALPLWAQFGEASSDSQRVREPRVLAPPNQPTQIDWNRQLETTIQSIVPGAYYFGQAQVAWQRGAYATAVVFGAASVADAAIAVGTFGISTAPTRAIGNTTHVAIRSASAEIPVVRAVVDVNAAYVSRGYRGPYDSAAAMRTIILEHDRVFVRAHGERNQVGKWLMRPDAVEGMTGQQVRDAFALPELPTTLSDVLVPSGTRLRVGRAAPQTGWGEGGAVQYELMQRLGPEAFGNPRLLP